MKKFDRLPPQQRKEEIQAAALRLFNEKGFAATTMENIVEQVSLSKGGVYRLYPSTSAILADLILAGMHLRNDFYEERVKQAAAAGQPLTLPFLVEMIGDSMLLSPEVSAVYVEFLWEKRRDPKLEQLYQQLCATTVAETNALIRQCGADELLSGRISLEYLTELMNATILSLYVLDLREFYTTHRKQLCETIVRMLVSEIE